MARTSAKTLATIDNGWLAPDGTLYSCAEYGHIYTAQEIHDEKPQVRTFCAQLMREELAMPEYPPVDSILTEALERLGYLKLATRSGKTDWYWHQNVKRITPEQGDTLLAICAAQRKPWPSWLDKETRDIL